MGVPSNRRVVQLTVKAPVGRLMCHAGIYRHSLSDPFSLLPGDPLGDAVCPVMQAGVIPRAVAFQSNEMQPSVHS